MAQGTLVPLNDPTADAAYSPVAADGTNGNIFENNDGETVLVIHNPNANSITPTITVAPEADTEFADGNAIADLSPGAITDVFYVFRRLKPGLYKQRSGDNKGYMHVSFSGTLTGVELLALKA